MKTEAERALLAAATALPALQYQRPNLSMTPACLPCGCLGRLSSLSFMCFAKLIDRRSQMLAPWNHESLPEVAGNHNTEHGENQVLALWASGPARPSCLAVSAAARAKMTSSS